MKSSRSLNKVDAVRVLLLCVITTISGRSLAASGSAASPLLSALLSTDSSSSESCFGDLSNAVFADMHDGDKKTVTLVEGRWMTIRPESRDESWVVQADFDYATCTAVIDFDVPGKPSPPPVSLLATVWKMSTVEREGKLTLEFTDPSGTIAPSGEPLNHWVQL